MFEQKFAFSVVVFVHMRRFHSDFYCFFIFFLNGFRNRFLVLSRPSVLFEPNFHFSLVIFCSHVHMRHFDIGFLFFFLIFLEMGFLNSLIVRSRSLFCFVGESSLNCTSRLVLLCFLFKIFA